MVMSSAQLSIATPPSTVPSVALTSAGVRCAMPDCERPISGAPPRRPDLAPFCKHHRALLTRGWQPKSLLDLTAVVPSAADEDRLAATALIDGYTVREPLYIEVTPGLALAFLERNRSNRPIAKDRVACYMRDILEDAWQVNSQGIAFGADGELYDGQHRLWAVVRSGRSVEMLIVRGLPRQARTTLDQGRPRSLGDTIKIYDGEADSGVIVSWFRAIEVLTTGRTAHVSYAIVRGQMTRYQPTLSWFISKGPRKRPYSRAAVVAALIYAHRVAANETESFATRYLVGADLPEGSPVLTLREYVFARRQIVHDCLRDVMLKTLHCLFADMRGERITRPAANEAALAHFQKLHAQLNGPPPVTGRSRTRGK